MKRRSLSASFGSWCIELIYNPRRAAGECFFEAGASGGKGQKASELALLLPGFLASWITVGAGCYALSHFVTASSFTSTLVILLLGAALISFGAQCFAPPWKRLCEASRWPLVVVLILLAISTRFSNVIPLDDTSESNALVAIFLCFITLLSVLLAGARSGGRIVPLSAPLVPGLSLFGLLCLISVDAEIQVCFLVFVAAAIYLLSYSLLLRRVRPDLTLGVTSQTARTAALPLRSEVAAWSKQSLCITGVWSGMFLVGGLLLYLPVQKFLPVLISPQLNRVRAAAQNVMLDYRGSASVMQLQGGNYTLSDREMMRVTVQQGQPSGLWRGRVYDHYNRSHWDESVPERSIVGVMRRFSQQRDAQRRVAGRHDSSRPELPFLRPLKSQPPILKPQEGSIRHIVEEIEPLDGLSNLIYASGPILTCSTGDGFGAGDCGLDLTDTNQARSLYFVRSFVVEPNWGVLLSAPGYEHSFKVPPQILEPLLDVPDDPELVLTLKSLVREMEGTTRRPPQTPFAKVRTISNYLLQNCTYSLNSPAVPATRDAVEFFLTESQQGACDMFASSMVLLLRQMNVPARLVTGYLQPEDNHSVSGLESPTFLLRERDAHAWVEYYVPKYGWLSYDPTAGTRTTEDAIPAQLAQWLSVPIPDVPSNLLLIPALGLGVIALGAVLGRPDTRAPHVSEVGDAQLRRLIEARYSRAVARLRRRVPHPAHLTPGEYEARVCRAVIPVDAKQEFAALTHLYIAARYGQLEPVSRTEVDACLARFEAALKVQRRVH